MSAVADARTQRLQWIARRWPRSAWDYRGLARWLSFDESYWTAVLSVGLLFSTAYFDVLLWFPGSGPLPALGNLGGSPLGSVLLVALVFFNGWILDRLLAARAPAGLREVPWVRTIRAILAAVPLLGLAIIPLWQRLTRNPPPWAFVPRRTHTLDLEKNLPASLGLTAFRTTMDIRLRAGSQRIVLQLAWLIGCQIATWLSGLYLIARDRSRAAVALWVLLHIAGAAAGLAHAALRSSLLQMTPGRSLAFRLLPLALLLPLPFSLAALLAWLPASENPREDKGIIQTLYSARAARRHPLAAARRPWQGEILGSTELRRHQAVRGKIFLLFFESAALSRLAAAFGFFLIPVWVLQGSLLLILLALPALPGAFLLFAGMAGRLLHRSPRLDSLANHPSCEPLILVPPVLLLGVLSGDLNALRDAGSVDALLLLAGFLGADISLLAAMWSFILSLFFGKPERPYTGKILVLFLFLILVALSRVLARPPIFLGIVILGALLSPLVGFAIAARWVAPFRWRDLGDRRLPAPYRKLLKKMTLTAILPLGALALPWWGEMRRRHRSALDRWAARLREPAA